MNAQRDEYRPIKLAFVIDQLVDLKSAWLLH
jgi:hypothetical protein